MTVKEAFEKIAQDKDLREKVNTLTTPEEIYALAQSVGAGMSFEEFRKGAEEIQVSLGKMSDADVDAIFGGIDIGNTTLTATTNSTTITTIFSIAAI